MPSIFAASDLEPVVRRAFRTYMRRNSISASARVLPLPTRAVSSVLSTSSCGSSSAWMVSDLASTTLRSITFSSSLMLPGQS